MLWLKKQPKQGAQGTVTVERDVIEPAELTLPFDPRLFQQHFSQLKAHTELDAGLEAYLDSLKAKQQFFAGVLADNRIDQLTLADVAAMLEFVFTARRRVLPVLKPLGEQKVKELVKALLYGEGLLTDRLQQFVDGVPVPAGDDKESRKQTGKTKRAIYDFAAEMLHFMDPVKYPLMTRWVWDQSTVSGSLREFIKGSDHMVEVPLGNSPEMFEGTRKWLAEQYGELGIYKEVPLMIDLLLAEGYSSYFRSMAEGVLSADFGRSGGPEEHLKKFLGLDGDRRSGKSRVVQTGPDSQESKTAT